MPSDLIRRMMRIPPSNGADAPPNRGAPAVRPAGGELLNPETIRQLVDMVTESRIADLVVEFAGRRVHIAGATAGPATGTQERSERTWHCPVCAPAVGVVRWRLEDHGASLTGRHLPNGTLIADVHSCGTWQEVRTPVAGDVAVVLATDGEAVEYGQPLLILRVRGWDGNGQC